MSAVAERPITITEVPRRPATEKDACALALSYLRWASACWRGDTLAPVFATQLGACWRPELPPMPAGPRRCHQPARWGWTRHPLVSHGRRGSRICPGAAGGYQVPVAAIPQLVRCTHTRPRTTQGTWEREFGKLRPEERRYPVQ